MERLHELPTSDQLTTQLDSNFSDVVEGLETVSKGLHDGLTLFAGRADDASNHLIREMRKLLTSTINDIAENLKRRDDIFFNVLKEQRDAITAIQNRNEETIQQLSNKVMDLSGQLITFKQSYVDSDQLKTSIITEQLRRTDQRFTELRDDGTLTREQLTELVNSVKTLSDDIQTLSSNVDNDKKGEKSQSRPAPRQVLRSTPSAAPSSSSRPPPAAIPLAPSTSSRQPSSSQTEVTPVGGRLTSTDPMFVNRQLQGVYIQGEERINMPDLGPMASAEEMLQQQREGEEVYRRRREAERRDPPKPKRKPPVRYRRN